MNNIAVVIPARYKSSRLPGKLMININDVPIIHHTYNNVLKSKLIKKENIYIFTDSEIILNYMKKINNNVILTDENCQTGNERICKYLHKLNSKFDYIVNIQADEPFINSENIDFAINCHLENKNTDKLFYTTLHQKIDDNNYLNSQACLTVQFKNNNDVITYSRNVLPGNKLGINDINKFDYYGFTGIYVFNIEYLKLFNDLPDTKYQLFEDIEQMKIIENGYTIKTFECPKYNEISINTKEDLDYLLDKYCGIKNQKSKIKLVVFDLDGVFTNSKIYIDEKNNLTKCYNGKDSYALKLLLNRNIKTALITAHETDCVKYMSHIVNRMNEVVIGKYDKVTELNRIRNKYNIELNEIAYIGDDLPDLECMKLVGFTACPLDAVSDVKKYVNFISTKVGGDGAVREFIEYLINKNLIFTK
jgi:3-deoxy-D-manno-octulosonate 8-phosphate phosphatase (KDO 8-P phosphatase)